MSWHFVRSSCWCIKASSYSMRAFCFHSRFAQSYFFPAHYRKKWWLPRIVFPPGFGNTWQHQSQPKSWLPLTFFFYFINFHFTSFCQDFVPVWISALALKCGLLVFGLEFVWPQINQWIVPLLNFLFHFLFNLCSG